MAKPKITRLGDPANPYTPGKVTRTGPQNRPTPAAIREAQRKGPPAIPMAKPAPARDMRSGRQRQLDAIIDGAARGSGKKK